ncbi:glutathione S-transferase family protein [Aspergillus puulaauensis]|uniref:Thioredoxin-like fold domain-containing protein n=1 Tax=Aspergillus puulaauensis TaxID=1220207 RepID=A0A7R8APT8_9EURO|nr:uncharacterized protein APUU_51004S [Aspergillus puulaauensis]BCS26292.1 hypothetical protein APUU_51004S [Aspergillus puulaauensis]
MSTITIYRGWLEPGRYVWSPFVTKVEARLRFANITYKTAVGTPKTAPKGKIPYIEITDGNEAEASTSIGDSTLIIKHLVERNILPDLNGDLAPELKANDLAIRALLEDKAYFYNTRERWTENYYTMRDHVLGAVPYPIRVVIGMLIHRTMVQTLHGQGTGRYSADEVQEFRVEAWNAVNDLLVASKVKKTQHQEQQGDADQPFWVLGGEEPTEADTTVFGFVISALICTAGPKARELVMGFPVMREYARRIHDAYFPDYERWDE